MKKSKKKPNWRFYVLEISNTPFDWHFPFAKRGREGGRENPNRLQALEILDILARTSDILIQTSSVHCEASFVKFS